MTFDNCFKELLEFVKYEQTPHTITSKLSAYNKHIRPVVGALSMDSISYPIMQGVLNTMLKDGYAPKTVAHCRDIFRTTFTHALRCEYIDKNPSMLLRVKRIDNRRFLNLSKSEVASFISVVKNEADLYTRCLFMFLLHGRRLNEARQLQWSWIDFERKSVTIPALHSKDRFSHVYALTDDFLENLKFLPCLSEFVFPSRVTGVQFVDISKSFHRILRTAGIEKGRFRIHDIRHLVGTVAISSGKSLEDVKYALGHNSITTTMRYVSQDATKSRGVSDLIFSVSVRGL